MTRAFVSLTSSAGAATAPPALADPRIAANVRSSDKEEPPGGVHVSLGGATTCLRIFSAYTGHLNRDSPRRSGSIQRRGVSAATSPLVPGCRTYAHVTTRRLYLCTTHLGTSEQVMEQLLEPPPLIQESLLPPRRIIRPHQRAPTMPDNVKLAYI